MRRFVKNRVMGLCDRESVVCRRLLACARTHKLFERAVICFRAACTAVLFPVFFLFLFDLYFSAPSSSVFLLFLLLLANAMLFTKVSEGFLSSDALFRVVDCAFGREKTDRAVKRYLHSIALFIAVLWLYAAGNTLVFLSSSSGIKAVFYRAALSCFIPSFALFLLLKNALIFRLFSQSAPPASLKKTRRHLTALGAFSAVYWALFYLLCVNLGSGRVSLFVLCSSALALFALTVLLYDLTFRRQVTYQNLSFNRRRVAAVLLLCFVGCGFLAIRRDRFYVRPFIDTVPVVPHRTFPISYEESGVYTIVAPEGDFRILHLTDIHLGGSLFSYRKDLLALKACFRLINATRPDLVIVTGDLCFPLGIFSMSFNNSAPVYAFASFMRNVGIPWAFAYGNHDTESIASMGKAELDALFRSLSFRTSANLLYPYAQPAVTGRNNQLICVRNEDGTLRQALFLLDSNAYTGEGFQSYDYIRDDQVAWYREEVLRLQKQEGTRAPSLVFFHIPLREYKEAYSLYLQGSSEVIYYFGTNEENKTGKICCSDHPSKLFDEMVLLGSTTGAFCGHDHYNNISLSYKGIRLTYGMSIDYLAMPGIEQDVRQRGGEVITLCQDSTWTVEQVPLWSVP